MPSLKTPLCDLLNIEIPILQAGMGRAVGSPTTPDLVAAVSNAGGMGCLGAFGLEPDEIAAGIAAVRVKTDRPFAVDLLLPASLAEADLPREEVRRKVQREHPEHWRFTQGLYTRFGLDPDVKSVREYAISPTLIGRQVEVVLDDQVPVFVAGLGDPALVASRMRSAGIRTIGLAGSPRHAERQREAGVDAIIAQGYEAGGHTGAIATFALVPQVVDRVSPTPVLAAGGIADGRGIVAALALGAQGVWCGTAFLFAQETDLHPLQREQLIGAESRDLVVGRSYTGKPSRVFQNEVALAWASSGLDPLPMPLQSVLMEDFTFAAQMAGRYELVNNPAGQIAGMLHEQAPAATIFQRMVEEAYSVTSSLCRGD